MRQICISCAPGNAEVGPANIEIKSVPSVILSFHQL